jgi:cellulose synthase/poly-beta-1,6-N-acetylglucosamine synthase-like glycosyltransferase
MWLTIYAWCITVGWLGVTLYVLIYSRKVAFLKDLPPVKGEAAPSVAVIIAVRNEEAEVEEALSSVCALDYPAYTVLAVNDRSTDRTPQILAGMAVRHPALRLLTITELPDGWLGKNHALHQGYRATASEWMLFTDADVLFQPRALSKAVRYAEDHGFDHLVALPQIKSPSLVFMGVMNTFALMLEVRQRPWSASNPASSASLGVGAFNLVRRTAYEKVGGHEAISLRPDDDLKLGAHLKRAGFRQGVVYGNEEVSLQWYSSLAQFISGLMKNTFSIANYRWPVSLGMALLTLVVFVLPLPLLGLMGGEGIVLALVLLLSHIILLRYKRGSSGVWWHGLMVPFAGAILVYIILAATVKTLRQGGIYWRDHFYPLSELRKQR